MKKLVYTTSVIIIVIGSYFYYSNYMISPEKKEMLKTIEKNKKIEKEAKKVYKKSLKEAEENYVKPLEKITITKDRIIKEKALVGKFWKIYNKKEKGDIYAYMSKIEEVSKDIKTPEEKKLIYPVLIEIYQMNDEFDKMKKTAEELKILKVDVNKMKAYKNTIGGDKK
ncbi:hypothetical protein [Haliovirga abyssi]|uniref:Lipoprotein n=1 Tax=Haliovirga abyssi TaxID=2996794 RepID=A0AAU9DIA0_9FUSO|nr:hypothetical protein [Haliovirga abyssi]BDU51307.1 hypothetical protein HLVA_18760 [Haliovirga abyssi]